MRIAIYIATQTLDLLSDSGELLQRYPVSTASKGCGEINGSEQTPRGRHYIRACIGAGQARATVFRGRRPTGEIHDAALHAAHPQRDWILSRILWLCGCEPGINRLGNVDSMRRYIYIHGTPDQAEFGPPSSHGCIRMHNDDVIDLFARVPAGTTVDIHAEGFNCRPLVDPVRYLPLFWLVGQAELTAVRHRVFVVEQGVPLEMEVDADDALARHWLARAPSGQAIGTVRLTSAGHIGRLAVLAEWRGRGVGRQLLQQALQAALASGVTAPDLNAQLHALAFYEAAGFRAVGPEFDDAGILHKRMVFGV